MQIGNATSFLAGCRASFRLPFQNRFSASQSASCALCNRGYVAQAAMLASRPRSTHDSNRRVCCSPTRELGCRKRRPFDTRLQRRTNVENVRLAYVDFGCRRICGLATAGKNEQPARREFGGLASNGGWLGTASRLGPSATRVRAASASDCSPIILHDRLAGGFVRVRAAHAAVHCSRLAAALAHREREAGYAKPGGSPAALSRASHRPFHPPRRPPQTPALSKNLRSAASR